MVQPRVTPWRVGPMSTLTSFIDMMSPARSTCSQLSIRNEQWCSLPGSGYSAKAMSWTLCEQDSQMAALPWPSGVSTRSTR
ncbi:hypothetical protein D3C71_1998300 [compost metagenome]